MIDYIYSTRLFNPLCHHILLVVISQGNQSRYPEMIHHQEYNATTPSNKEQIRA